MASKKPRSERYRQWEIEHQKDKEMVEGIHRRLTAHAAREAERQARLRRWTFGLLGRQPTA